MKYIMIVLLGFVLSGCAGTTFSTGNGGTATLSVPLYTTTGRGCFITATQYDKVQYGVSCR